MFVLSETRELPLYHCVGRRYIHDSGLQVLSLETADVENMFSICIPTPPTDNTGVPHIIEHTVLSGSRHYPVKEPFNELNKCSLATFLNALTYQDHTVYPVATTVPSEYFSMADVYFDAVFAPLLERDKFLQEGWRYAFSGKGTRSKLVVNGIVYNEMWGDYYDVDVVVAREMARRLLAGNPRSFVSGGDPLRIPELSYAGFRRFYREHYHPSRALVFLYGNIPTEEKLAFLEERLGSLHAAPPPPLPARIFPCAEWMKETVQTVRYLPTARNKELCAWARQSILTATLDPFQDLTFEFLQSLLMRNTASPLKKRLLDSGLFDNFGISGYDNESPETAFLLTITGVERKNLKPLGKLVRETLASLAKEHYTSEQLSAVFMLSKWEELTVGQDFVFDLMERVFDSWSYGLDPFCFLDRATLWDRLEKTLRSDDTFLNRTIQEYLVDNPKTLTLELLPDVDLRKRNAERQHASLAKKKERMAPATLRGLLKQEARLTERLLTPDTPEALATLPRLRKGDVPRTIFTPKYTRQILSNGCDFRVVEDFSGGITRLNLALELPTMDAGAFWAFRSLVMLLRKLGTHEIPYDRNILRWESAGTNFAVDLLPCNLHLDLKQPALRLRIRLGALDEGFVTAVRYLREQLHGTTFTERGRIHSLWRQERAKFREMMSNGSGTLAMLRASAGLAPLNGLVERYSGISAGAFIEHQMSHFGEDFARLGRDCPPLLSYLLANARTVAAAFFGNSANLPLAQELAAEFGGGSIPVVGVPLPLEEEKFAMGRKEHFTINSNVACCVRALQGPSWDDAMTPGLMVYATLLSNGFLWDTIRVRGGAYGVSCSVNPDIGGVFLSTTCDPSPQLSLRVFDALATRRDDWTDGEVENAVISTVRSYHVPLRGAMENENVFRKAVEHLEDEEALQFHDKLLSVTKADVLAAREAFWAGRPKGNDCVMTPGRQV